MSSAPLTLAAAQYPITRLADWAAYRAKLESWVGEAAGAGAQLLLFPEYGAMELTALFPEAVQQDLAGQISALQDLLPDFRALHAELAARHGVWIVAASLPVRHGNGYRNVAHVYGPEGEIGFQEKLIMTRFEREIWHIDGGDQPKVFDAPFGRFAINICYDVEFPLIARAQAEAGATLLLAPSCTDTLAGYYRVRLGAQARALENQCFVVQSPTVGDAPWSPAVDENRGAAAVYGPPDYGLPADGVVRKGVLDQPQWVFATLDLEESARIRTSGQVFNHRDWDDQKTLKPVAG